MTTYLSTPVPYDKGSLRATIDARMLELNPGLDTTSPLTAYDTLADAFTTVAAEILQTLTQQLAIGMRGSMEKVDRIIQRDAVQSAVTGTLTRTAASAAGGELVVPAGTGFDLQGSDGAPVAFQTVNDETFTGTDDEIEDVDLIASLGGTGGNGLTTVIGPAQTVVWYLSLTLDAPTSGGEDAEDDDAYLNRGADEKPGRSFAIVRPDDLARFLRNQPSVGRVQVINNYNADTATSGVGGHMTAIVTDADGTELSDGTMDDLKEAAQANAVTDGIIHITGPTDTTVTVVFAGVADPNFDAGDVEARSEQAVTDFLSRARFGLPDYGDDPTAWLDLRTVYYDDLITVLNNVPGFNRKTSLTINGGTSDLVLAGPGALPDYDSSVNGTVT